MKCRGEPERKGSEHRDASQEDHDVRIDPYQFNAREKCRAQCSQNFDAGGCQEKSCARANPSKQQILGEDLSHHATLARS